MRKQNVRARRRLRERLQQVLARYQNAQDRLTDGLEGREIEDMGHAVQLWDTKVLAALTDADLAVLADVLSGLRRVADGTYGRCLDCGDAIAPARLEALPESARCIECARAAEQPIRRTA